MIPRLFYDKNNNTAVSLRVDQSAAENQQDFLRQCFCFTKPCQGYFFLSFPSSTWERIFFSETQFQINTVPKQSLGTRDKFETFASP